MDVIDHLEQRRPFYEISVVSSSGLPEQVFRSLSTATLDLGEPLRSVFTNPRQGSACGGPGAVTLKLSFRFTLRGLFFRSCHLPERPSHPVAWKRRCRGKSGAGREWPSRAWRRVCFQAGAWEQEGTRGMLRAPTVSPWQRLNALWIGGKTFQNSPSTCPSARAPRFCQVPTLIFELILRTEPSIKAAFTIPV